MIKIFIKLLSIFIIAPVILFSCIYPRSLHRPIDRQMPELIMKWADQDQIYRLRNAHLEEYPWFGTFDAAIFNQYRLPANTSISFRNNSDQSVNSTLLSNLIDQVLDEIKERKKTYTHFIILQTKDFNRKKICGLIVLKFKDYPFVVKLFIETPKSFTNPWAKGFEPIFFFYMGGGVNRHLSGFTRLKNHTYIAHRLEQDDGWAALIDVPRKWSYIPKNSPWIDITSKNIGKQEINHIKIPGTYALIADAIEMDPDDSLHNPAGRALAVDLCNFLNMQIDPHIKNFMIESSTKKLVIVDTEHLPTMVGFKEQKIFKNYSSWIAELLKKCAKNMLFSTKDELRCAQYSSTASFHAPFFSIDDENLPASAPAA